MVYQEEASFAIIANAVHQSIGSAGRLSCISADSLGHVTWAGLASLFASHEGALSLTNEWKIH